MVKNPKRNPLHLYELIKKCGEKGMAKAELWRYLDGADINSVLVSLEPAGLLLAEKENIFYALEELE